jgi:CheY-like chemotaxis protein
MSVADSFVILLAEDEPADAYLVKMALVENHILAEVEHVMDGREALAFLQRQGARFASAPRPSLVLLDLNMPRMNGLECLAQIKQDPMLRDIPVIILTTSDVERDIAASYNLGAAGFITKPVDMNQFIHTIGQIGHYWFRLVNLPGDENLTGVA